MGGRERVYESVRVKERKTERGGGRERERKTM
jgi:hypothetical protein